MNLLRRNHNKAQFNLATEVLKSFSASVFYRLSVTHSKSSNNGHLEPENELTIYLFLM